MSKKYNQLRNRLFRAEKRIKELEERLKASKSCITVSPLDTLPEALSSALRESIRGTGEDRRDLT